jgi:hypothetical protein
MEMVSMDMKAKGMFLARSLSYEGAEYSITELKSVSHRVVLTVALELRSLCHRVCFLCFVCSKTYVRSSEDPRLLRSHPPTHLHATDNCIYSQSRTSHRAFLPALYHRRVTDKFRQKYDHSCGIYAEVLKTLKKIPESKPQKAAMTKFWGNQLNFFREVSFYCDRIPTHSPPLCRHF